MIRASKTAPPGWVVMAAVGVTVAIAAVVELLFVDQRTLWLDEVATVSSSTRSWDSLAVLTSKIDFVHWSYYALLHVWFDIVGYSPFALRAVSAIAVALTAGVLVLIGQRLLDLATGLIAALVFLAMPNVSLIAANGRSQALEMLCAALASLLVIVAIDEARRRPSRSWVLVILWGGYAVVSFAGISLQLWFVFVVAGHAVTVLISVLSRRRARVRVMISAGVAIVVVAAVTVPFALHAMAQSSQIGWLKAPTLTSAAVTLLRDQSFNVQLVQRDLRWIIVLAALSWTLVVVGIVWAAVRRPSVIAVAVPWQFLPVVGLFLISVAVVPTYTDRYLAMCCPALALLVGTGVRALLHRWLSVLAGVALVVLLLGGVHGWQVVRWGIPTTPDYHLAATMIANERAADPGERQALAFGVLQRPGAQLSIGYPGQLRGVDDLTYGSSTPPAGWFWPDGKSQGDAAAQAGPYQVLWYVSIQGVASDQFAQAIGSGFTLRSTTSLQNGVTLFRFDRAT